MIRDFTNSAANERTFLAWVRTGIAIITLGFVIERFNLFLLTLAGAVGEEVQIARLHRLGSSAGRYGGIVLVGAGVVLIVVATLRFLHTARLLTADAPQSSRATYVSLYVLSALVLGVAAFSAYLALG